MEENSSIVINDQNYDLITAPLQPPAAHCKQGFKAYTLTNIAADLQEKCQKCSGNNGNHGNESALLHTYSFTLS